MGVSAGKEDPVEFDSSLMLCNNMWGVVQVGGECHHEPMSASPLGSMASPVLLSSQRPLSSSAVPQQVTLLVQTSSEIPLPSPLFYSLSCQRSVAMDISCSSQWLQGQNCAISPFHSQLVSTHNSGTSPSGSLRTLFRLGVWLGRHACYITTHAS